MRELKNSGVDWIGEIPSDWEIVRTKYKFKNTKQIVGMYADNFERLALTMRGVIKRSKDDNVGLQPEKFETYQILKENELVFKLIDLQNVTTSRVGLSSYEGIVSPAYIILRSTDDILPCFAEKFFLMMWKNEVFNALGDAGVRSSLNSKELLNIPIVLPTVKEQERIVHFLDAKCSEIDALISEMKNQISILEEYRNSIISEAVTKGINSNAKMKSSGVEWCHTIPESWNVTNPKTLFSLRNQRAEAGERQLTASQKLGIIYQDEFMAKENQNVVTVEKDFSILKHVEPNDFVISMRSFQGGLEYSELSGSISSAYVMLIPNDEKVYPPFYRWFFKSSQYINALQSTTNLVRDGQAMRYANFAKVPLFEIPLEEQKSIAIFLNKKISCVDHILEDKQKQCEILENYKNAIIYEYVTGKKEAPIQ